MKTWKVAALVIVLFIIGLLFGAPRVLSSIMVNKTKNVHRNVSFVDRAISDYRAAHHGYPTGTTEDLLRLLEPRAAAVAKSWECKYSSDGKSYELSCPSLTPREPFVFQNGSLKAFPKSFTGRR